MQQSPFGTLAARHEDQGDDLNAQSALQIYKNRIVGQLVLPSKLDRNEGVFERKHSTFNFLTMNLAKTRRMSAENEDMMFRTHEGSEIQRRLNNKDPDQINQLLHESMVDVEDSLNLMNINHKRPGFSGLGGF